MDRLEEKNIVGIDLEFKIVFKEPVDAEVGVSTLNKIESIEKELEERIKYLKKFNFM